MSNTFYNLLTELNYLPYIVGLKKLLPFLEGNRVSYQKEIHRDSQFAICEYGVEWRENKAEFIYKSERSETVSSQKKTLTPPSLMDCDAVRAVLAQFMQDIEDETVSRVEVKIAQTNCFPFEFNVHRDSQFRRLRHIKYLGTLLIEAQDIEGGNMQLFHSEGDQVGPFTLIEELPCNPGTGYIVEEQPHKVFHGMKTAIQAGGSPSRSALLLRFF